jgi:hypothetical protein
MVIVGAQAFEQKVACVARDGWRCNWLIVEGESVTRLNRMNAGSFFPGEAVPLTQCACRTFDVMEDRVNDGWRGTNRDTSPCVMRNRFHHHLPRRMPHSLVQPQCLLNHVRIDSVGLPGIFPFLWSGGSYTGEVVGLLFVRLIVGDSKMAPTNKSSEI